MSVCRCNEWVLCEPNFFVCRFNEWVLCEPNFFYLDLFESMHVFFLMAFKCARGLGITVKLSFIFFVTCDLIYYWHLKHNACVVCESDSSYDFILIFFKLCKCFVHGLNMYIWFRHYRQFSSFFQLVNLVVYCISHAISGYFGSTTSHIV